MIGQSTPREYVELERAILAAVHQYRKVHDLELLQSAAAAVSTLADAAGESAGISDRQEFRAVGWVMPTRGIRLRKRVLLQLNPGYRVKIKRVPRRELGRRAALLKVGFEITAVGKKDLPPFLLRVIDRSGTMMSLPGSNFDSAFALRVVEQQRSAGAIAEGPAPEALGWIDSVRIAPTVEQDRTTWLGHLAHAHPSELLELVESQPGRFLAERLAEVMGEYLLNARWADRFTLSAFGDSGEYRSDLSPLLTRRTDAALGEDSTLLLPVPSRQGRVVTWTPGPTPVRQPSTEWLRLENAEVQDGGTVIVGDTLVVYEASADPSNDFVAGQWRTVFGSKVRTELVLVHRRPPALGTIREAILLAGRNDDNWFHWLIEYLPRALQLQSTIGPEVPFVVTTRTPPTGLQALRRLTGRSVVAIDADFVQRIDVLHVVAPPVQVLDTTKVPWSAGLRLNAAVLQGFRASLGVDTLSVAATRRIFLRRKSRHRGVRNEEELARIAVQHGLELVDPGSLSFDQQCELFSSAQLIAGASGAVMANFIMMQPGSSVLALTSEQLWDFVLPAALAHVGNVHFSYVTGESEMRLEDVPDRNHWIHADFTVDPVAFEHSLLAELRRLDPA